MSNLTFSIIIPVYNVELYLRQCLDSVINQSFQNFEVICINDGSTDGSGAILDEYSKKNDSIKVISQKNKGLSAARNAGIKAAKGDYVFFLDSDDWIEKDTLKILSESISNEDVICFNGRRYFESGTEEEPDKGIVEEGLAGWDYYNKYALKTHKFHFVCVVLRLYKRDFLLKNNLYFEKGIYHEDNLFTPIACYYAKKIKVIPDSLYIYRIREGSITKKPNLKHLTDTIFIANKLAEFFVPITDIDKTIVYREIAGEYFKGFLPKEREIYGKNDKVLKLRIEWGSFKSVAHYPRHKRIYCLLKTDPILFRMYVNLESFFKQFKSVCNIFH